MEPRKLSVMFSFLPYGSNGGTAQEHPNIRSWYARTRVEMVSDPRIGQVFEQSFSDTPVPMVRNEIIFKAKECGADVVIMIDSDQHMDLYLDQLPEAKPFFWTAFNFIYERYEQGPNVVLAPYCGSPPHENVFVFRWGNWESNTPEVQCESVQFTREDAAIRMGMEQIACGPTGVIMYDMRIFDILTHPYFDYEWEGDGACCKACGQPKPGPRAYKASTEDVVNTRDLALIGQLKLGYNPLWVAWDCWAGHYKPKCVGKPMLVTIDQINDRFVQAVRSGNRQNERLFVAGNQVGQAIPAAQPTHVHHKPFVPVNDIPAMSEVSSQPPEKTVVQQIAERHELGTQETLTAVYDAPPDWNTVTTTPVHAPLNGHGGSMSLNTEDDPVEVMSRHIHVRDTVKRRVLRQRYISERELGDPEDMGLMDSEEFYKAAMGCPTHAWGRVLNQ